jgi:hypothetical protein
MNSVSFDQLSQLPSFSKTTLTNLVLRIAKHNLSIKRAFGELLQNPSHDPGKDGIPEHLR